MKEIRFGFICYHENMMMKILVSVYEKDKGVHRERVRGIVVISGAQRVGT
jgi:hypothetical protein